MEESQIAVVLLKAKFGHRYSVRDQLREKFPNVYARACVGNADIDVIMVKRGINDLEQLRDEVLGTIEKIDNVIDAKIYIGIGKIYATALQGFTDHILLRDSLSDERIQELEAELKNKVEVLFTARLAEDISGIIITKVDPKNWNSLFTISDYIRSTGLTTSRAVCP